jgi:Transglycosylase SLT domain
MRRVLIVLLTVAIGLAGCGSPGADTGDSTLDTQGQSLPTESAEPAEPEPSASGVAVFGKAPAAKASPSPTRRRSTAAARPAPSPSRRPVKVAGPPPPAPKPAPVTDRPCPYHEGTDASRSTVKSALVAAANTHFWSSADITVPVNLMKAVAWQESGWQSTIIACDGGIGTMQIMPDTEDWMNQRFGTSYDAHTLTGNTKIGAAYLEWNIKYFGDVYFNGDYTLDAADCPDETSPCLLNAVIASYNFGFGAVDTDEGLVIPNPQYVRNVRALMTECECLSF